jgi:diguanylate cyclase (GGDEF)-like protein
MFEEARRAYRQNHNLFLAVLDIDNLKEVNDQHGHLEGDKLLKTAAEIIRHCIRENVDWPFRYGGDEFCVILTQVSREQAMKTSKRFIQKFDEKKLPLTGLSIGLARFIRAKDNKWAEDIADLVKRADNALYRAKQTGRNRVMVDGQNG